MLPVASCGRLFHCRCCGVSVLQPIIVRLKNYSIIKYIGLTFNTCTLCPHCIYVLFIYVRTNSNPSFVQHKLIGFYNRDEKCLQRGTDWVFK
jgi:hypothetical protein